MFSAGVLVAQAPCTCLHRNRVRPVDRHPDEDGFYDLETDSMERFNLIHSPVHREEISHLRNRLIETLKRTNGMQIPLWIPQGFRGGDSRLDDAPSTDPLLDNE